MAFPNRPHRRVNYNYLAKLDEALEQLGWSTNNIPTHVLRSPWPIIKDFLQDQLHLRVCAWCKLPLPESQMCATTNMCHTHRAQLEDTQFKRRSNQTSTQRSIKAKRANSRLVLGMQDLLRPHSEPESEPLDGSMPEQSSKLPTGSSALDILDRASRRPDGK